LDFIFPDVSSGCRLIAANGHGSRTGDVSALG